jgi:hypothetical protein
LKPLVAGSEIDAWCTRCKLVLGHRIVAMIGKKPVRVECQTCDSVHNYKAAAPNSGGVTPVVRNRDGTISPVRIANAPTPRSTAKSASTRTGARTSEWETRISGQPVTAFSRYSMSKKYTQGELIHHPKFGDGFVATVLDSGKVSIVFKDGAKTLAHGQAV